MSPRTQTRAEKLAKKRAYAKRTYDERKLRQVCVWCEAELQDGDSVTCGTCTARDLNGKRRRGQTPRGRKLAAARSERDRTKRMSRGQCMYCTKPRVDGHRMCVAHRNKHRAAQRTYRARKAGVVAPARQLELAGVLAVAVGPRMPMKRAPHKILTPIVVTAPPGWTLEADIREELLALSELVALRKVG